LLSEIKRASPFKQDQWRIALWALALTFQERWWKIRIDVQNLVPFFWDTITYSSAEAILLEITSAGPAGGKPPALPEVHD
jgi:hypothetical protein